jgi:hypothetical protein
MSPEELFIKARADLERLAAGAFAIVAEKHDEKAFGSRYVTLARFPESCRLVWDGKEEWLALEWALDAEQASQNMWEDVGLWRYPLNEHSRERAVQILEELSAEFFICLQQTIG